jgi:PAS domain S-box-containing protein
MYTNRILAYPRACMNTKDFQPDVLIVDDYPANLEVLVVMLKSRGYHLRTAHDGAHALELIAEKMPDLIIMDIMMPVMNGFDTAKHLKSQTETTHIPIIFLSALNDTSDKVKAFECGAVDYMTKPINVQELLVRVKTQIDLHIRGRENQELRQHLATQNARLGQIVEERTQQLNRLNQRTSAILAGVNDSIILLSDTGTIEMTNKGFDTRFGYAPDELFGHPLTAITTPENARILAENFMLVQPNQAKSFQLMMRCKNDSHFEADVSIAVINKHTENAQLVMTCHDISYLQELARLKDDFISMVTHELRTPITGINLIATQLRQYDDRMDATMRQRKLDQLITQSKVMTELVASVLDISKLERRKLKHNLQEMVNVGDLAYKTLEEQLPISSSKEQDISFFYDNNTPSIVGDSAEIERIWRNLISNAIKYTPENGTIIVRLGQALLNDNRQVSDCLLDSTAHILPLLQPNHYIIGQVTDNGHGISPEHLQQLFTRFNRGWAKSSNIPGTGLGLALIRDLIMAYGGNIHVESELGRGSQFTFWLPLFMSQGE